MQVLRMSTNHYTMMLMVCFAIFVVVMLYQMNNLKLDLHLVQTGLESGLGLAANKLEHEMMDKLDYAINETKVALGPYQGNNNQSGGVNFPSALESLAQVKEYVLKFDSSDLPKDVRKWYTYVSKDVEYLNTLEQHDKVLINYIRGHLLVTPSPKHVPYNLKDPNVTDGSQYGQVKELLSIFKNKKNGTFIECGAFNGESISNTLVLEKDFGWSGVLIEADPTNFQTMLTKNRRSWMVPACLSLNKKPHLVAFAKNTVAMGKIANVKDVNSKKSSAAFFDIHCMPLTSILLALNMTDIDMFSLDIEGHEMDVLRTLDFDLIKIKVLTAEFSRGKEPKEAMVSFMEGKGYRNLPGNSTWGWGIENFMFIKKDSGL